MNKEFICNVHETDELYFSFPAFMWKNGKLFGLAPDGNQNNDDIEFLYAHLQKRAMKFNSGLENENSFMIIPNEFVKSHELTNEEIKALTTSDDEYSKYIRHKYNADLTAFERIIKFLSRDNTYKLIKLKNIWNHLIGRKLPEVIYN